MRDYLKKTRSPFKNLEWKSTLWLLELLRKFTDGSPDYLERRFRERARYFVESMDFLVELGIASFETGRYELHKQLSNVYSGQTKPLVLEQLAAHRNKYSLEICDYFGRFNLKGRNLAFNPPDHERSMNSDVRNFLMEMGIVRYSRSEGEYRIVEDHFDFWHRTQKLRVFVSPQTIEEKSKKNLEIGLEAEKVVLEFELNRVHPQLKSLVEHSSLYDSSLGYDIMSVQGHNEKDIKRRYVEVKAVSSNDFGFYWTENEMRAAKVLNDQYFLYLIPVIGEGKMALSKMKTVQNPYKQIIKKGKAWTVTTTSVHCIPSSLKTRNFEEQRG